MSATRRTVRGLQRLLEEQRAALLAGRLDRLPALTGRVETALDQLGRLASEGAVDPELEAELRALRDSAVRVRRLTEASQRGLKAARRTREEIASARTRLVTYNGSGARRDIASPPHTSDRRT